MNENALAVIVPYYGTDIRFRLRNLRAVVRRWREILPSAALIIAEQPESRYPLTETDLHDMPSGVSHFIGEPADSFAKCRLMNAAVRKFRPDIVVMGDAVAFPGKGCAASILTELPPRGLLFPFSSTNYMGEHDTGRVYDGMDPENPVRPGLIITRQTGLCVAMTLASFNACGGWDEAFTGWGAEDDALVRKCRRLFGREMRTRLTDTGMLHMYHPAIGNDVYKRESRVYRRNRMLCECIMKMDDADFSDYISGRTGLPALLDKYQSMGKIRLKVDYIYTKKSTISLDASIYDFGRMDDIQSLRLVDILRILSAEDGNSFAMKVIASIEEKVPDLSPAQKKEIEECKKEFSGS